MGIIHDTMWGRPSQSSLLQRQPATVSSFFPSFKALIPSSSTTLPFTAPLRSHLLSCRRTAATPFSPRKSVGAMAASLQDGGGEEGVLESRITKIAAAIRVIPDFPKRGIMFQDITTLLLEPKLFKDTIDLFVERYRGKNISVVAGIEARGFIFGPPIALAIGAKFVPMRKPKKLPGEVISEEYSLEYGTDRIEMHVGAVHEGERAIVIDDLIATGGTLAAAFKLLDRVGVEVVEGACLIELPELKGRDRLGSKPLFVLVKADS